jgi:GNAT superfamily N-acetyltransferase
MAREWAMATLGGALVIALAGPGDVETTVAIEEDATGWLRSRDIDPGMPPRPLHELFAEAIARGQMYLARRDGVAVGKVALTERDGLWADLPGEALYVHGLMVRRDFAGQEIGREMLRWAEGLAAERGKALLRLDCMGDNAALRAYYERAGFTHRGDVALPHRLAARYEKAV